MADSIENDDRKVEGYRYKDRSLLSNIEDQAKPSLITERQYSSGSSDRASDEEGSFSSNSNGEVVFDRGFRPDSTEALTLAETAKYSRITKSVSESTTPEPRAGIETAATVARNTREVGSNVESPKLPGAQEVEPATGQRLSVFEPGRPAPKESIATANSIDSGRAESANSVPGESSGGRVSAQAKGGFAFEGVASGSDPKGALFKATVERQEKEGSAAPSFAGPEQASNRKPAGTDKAVCPT